MAATTHASSMCVLGTRIDDIAPDAIVAKIADAVASRHRLLVVNANAHLLTLAKSTPWLRAMFDTAGIVFCDGAGAQLACKLITGQLPHRSTPPEWIDAVGRRLAETNASVFWLGGQADTAKAAAAIFAARTGVRNVGHHGGFFDQRAGSDDNAALVAQINDAAPDLLIVNMGMPRQEQWLRDHWHALDVRVALTAGALVDHVAGHVRRPPRWVANLGIEWAVRLAIEPKRLWRRYLLGLPLFGMHLLRALAAARLAHGALPAPQPEQASGT